MLVYVGYPSLYANEIVERTKVYLLRGEYKRYFLWVSEDGTHVYQPASLKVTTERTFEIYIEDMSVLPRYSSRT